MYFTDSSAQKIWAFDYDEETGNITNRRPFIDFESDDSKSALKDMVLPGSTPDGLCIDSEGGIWSARSVCLRSSRFEKNISLIRCSG
jgi:sugar lactone lactonase YvrE